MWARSWGTKRGSGQFVGIAAGPGSCGNLASPLPSGFKKKGCRGVRGASDAQGPGETLTPAPRPSPARVSPAQLTENGGIRKGLPGRGSAGCPAELRGRLSCPFYLAPGCQNSNALENEFIPSSELPACAAQRCKTMPAASETPERVFPEGSTSWPGPADDARMRSCLERTLGPGLVALGQIRLLFTPCWIIREVPQPPRPAELTPGVTPPALHPRGCISQGKAQKREDICQEKSFFLAFGKRGG